MTRWTIRNSRLSAMLAIGSAMRLTSSELAQALGVTEYAASRITGRLDEAGLVQAERVGRNAYWSLTPAGAQALHALSDDLAHVLFK